MLSQPRVAAIWLAVELVWLVVADFDGDGDCETSGVADALGVADVPEVVAVWLHPAVARAAAVATVAMMMLFMRPYVSTSSTPSGEGASERVSRCG